MSDEKFPPEDRIGTPEAKHQDLETDLEIDEITIEDDLSDILDMGTGQDEGPEAEAADAEEDSGADNASGSESLEFAGTPAAPLVVESIAPQTAAPQAKPATPVTSQESPNVKAAGPLATQEVPVMPPGDSQNVKSSGKPASPVKPKAQPLPATQEILDMQAKGLMTPQEAAIAAQVPRKPKKIKKGSNKEDGQPAVKKPAGPRFRWVMLLVLSLAGVTFWTVEAQFYKAYLYDVNADVPSIGHPYYGLLSWGVLLGTLLLTVGTSRFLRLPTRSGLAALAWAGTFIISAIYGPPEKLVDVIPAALIWAGMLILVMGWTGVAIWRKIGRYKIIDIILSLFLIFAAIGPVWALADYVVRGKALILNFGALSASPAFLTDVLPWFLWPMTVALVLVIPLAALFAFWDQLTVLRIPGRRHAGNLFLALAFIGLLPYGFFAFDKAVEENRDIASLLRSLVPSASIYARENQGQTPTAEIAKFTETVPAAQPEAVPVETLADATPPLPPTVTAEETVKAAQVAEDKAPSPPPAQPEPVQAKQEPEPVAIPPKKLAAPAPATAPSASSDDLARRLEETEKKLDEALRRINKLEEEMKGYKMESSLRSKAAEQQANKVMGETNKQAASAADEIIDGYINRLEEETSGGSSISGAPKQSPPDKSYRRAGPQNSAGTALSI